MVVARPPELYTPEELKLPVMSALATMLPSGLTRMTVLLPAATIVAPAFSGRQAMTRLSPSAARVIKPVIAVELDSVQPAASSEPLTLSTAGPVGSAIVCSSTPVVGEYSSRNASRATVPERGSSPLPRRRTTRLDGRNAAVTAEAGAQTGDILEEAVGDEEDVALRVGEVDDVIDAVGVSVADGDDVELSEVDDE